MASATASIACHLLDTGVGVGVRTRDEDVPVKAGDPHRREILAALARTEGGHVVQETGESGSMFVHADENGDVDVRLGMRSVAFTNLTSSSADQPAVLADGGSS